MKKLITYIFLLSLLISAVFIAKEAITFFKDIILLNNPQTEAIIRQERMLHPVVKITHIRSSSDTSVPTLVSSASGFSIGYFAAGNNSLIITNDHFCREVRPESSLIIENFQHEIIETINTDTSSRILITRPNLDLCLILINGFVSPAALSNRGAETQLFEKVFIVGGPSGDFPIIIDTYLSSYIARKDISIGALGSDGRPFLLTSEQIFPGHSGSPIYNEKGDVIGVVFGALPTYGGVGASSDDIHDLLEEYQSNL